jgi:hypothetical protein
MSKSLNLWYPEINPDIPKVPLYALREAVLAAAIRFCEKSHLWMITLDDIDVVADTADYTLTVPAEQYAEIVVVDNVKYRADGEEETAFRTVDPIGEVQEDRNRNGGWRAYETSGGFEYYVDPVSKTTLTLVGVPTESSTDGLRVRVVVKPLRTATVLPDFLYNEWREAIGCGAKANLFGRRGMAWYDPNERDKHEYDFRNACGNAKQRRATGSVNKIMRVKMRPLA